MVTASPIRRDHETPMQVKRRLLAIRRWWLIIAVIVFGIPVFRMIREHQRQLVILELKERCKDSKEEKNWEDLAICAEEWSTMEPDLADPWLYRSEAAEGLSQWDAVVKYLNRVPRSDRRVIRALVSKSVVEFERLNRPLEGVKTCDEILELDSRVLVAHKQSIFFYMMTLQREEAIRRVRRAIRAHRESPESYIFLVSGNWLYPGSLYRTNTRWLESDPGNEIFEVARAMQIYSTDARSHDVPTAEELFKKYPHNRELLSFFLNSAMANGDLERVEELLKQFPQELAESDVHYWRAKGWCNDVRGEFGLEEQALRKAFELDRYWWHIHFQLHELMRRLGRTEESAYYLKIYKISKELSTEITDLNQTPENLNEKKFCGSLLELAQLIEDDEVASVLRERVKVP